MLRLATDSERSGLRYGGLDPKLLGERIRELRLKKKWTQERLAAESGVAENTIRGLEKGTLNTRRAKYVAIARALDTTTDALERSSGPVTETHPLLAGLNEHDLRLAQAYSRAPTRLRLRIERLLLASAEDRGMDLLDRFDNLDAHRQEGLLLALTQHERQLAEDLAAATRRKSSTKKPRHKS
jgi:transcriptional regulator with XRE-family HTH domain